MPFKSEAQRKWMYANHPEMAARWQKHTPKGKKLPEHVGMEKKALWRGLVDELNKIAEEKSRNDEEPGLTPEEAGKRLLVYGIPTGLSSYVGGRIGHNLAVSSGKKIKRVTLPFSAKNYRDLREQMGIKERIPLYRTDASGVSGMFVVGDDDLRSWLGEKYPDRAADYLSKQEGPRIFARPNQPGTIAHELGHARLFFNSPKSYQARYLLGKITSRAAIPLAVGMAALGDEDSAAVKAAPLVASLAKAPFLAEEALAHWEGLSALKRMGIYSPENLRRLRLNAIKILGSRALPAVGMALPVGALSVIRSLSKKSDDGEEAPDQAS